MAEGKIWPHSQVVDTKLQEGDVVLLHLESKMYYSLNATGERIWRGLKEGLSLEDISRRLQQEFDVDEENADASIAELIAELREQNLVVSERDKRS